jgi:2-C-methyl-D-erythritol 2,4-cyclodiphosphate synthase
MAAEVEAPASPSRVGLGHDRHPFGPGEPLRLGGIEIAGAPRLHGHSDGDVVLHAIADAVLGAAGLGDLGRLAPADARTPRGIASAELLARATDQARSAGWIVASVDVMVTGARPRLAGHLDSMRDAIARALRLPTTRVSVKASTGNLQGPEGEGRAIAAEAIATLVERR